MRTDQNLARGSFRFSDSWKKDVAKQGALPSIDDRLEGFEVREDGKVVVHSEFADQVEGLGSPGVARDTLLEYAPERVVYEAESERGGLLVLSEVWYPAGWKAKVDGQDVDIVRANYLLRAIPLAAGKHTVELTFETELDSAASSANAGTAGLMVFVLGCVAMAWVQQRRKAA